MSGKSASTQSARSTTAAIGYAVNARWHAVNARVEQHSDAVLVSVPPSLGPYARRAIGGIISRSMGCQYGLARVEELDRRVRLIYRPSGPAA